MPQKSQVNSNSKRDGVHESSSAKRRMGAKRTLRACDRCRFKKSKCDGLQPCETCRQNDRTCVFSARCARDTRDWYNRMQEVVEEGFQRLYKATKEANVFPGILPNESDGKVSTEEILRGMGLRTEPMPNDESMTQSALTASPIDSTTTDQQELTGSWDNDDASDVLPLGWPQRVANDHHGLPATTSSNATGDMKQMMWSSLEVPNLSGQDGLDMRAQFAMAVGVNELPQPPSTVRKRSLQNSFRGALQQRIQSLGTLNTTMNAPSHGRDTSSATDGYHHPPRRPSTHEQYRTLPLSTRVDGTSNIQNRWQSPRPLTVSQLPVEMDTDMAMGLGSEKNMGHNETASWSTQW